MKRRKKMKNLCAIRVSEILMTRLMMRNNHNHKLVSMSQKIKLIKLILLPRVRTINGKEKCFPRPKK